MATTTPSPSPSVTTPEDPPGVTDAVGSLGTWATSAAPLRIVGVIVCAVILHWMLSRLIKRVVNRTVDRSTHDRGNGAGALSLLKERREQRAHAIGQLVRSVVAVVIWSLAVLMILPLFGLDIAPLLASAGVLGVALGFGAQTLIKDYLSGIFLILEDQYGVGDMVDLGEAIGTVEEVTLRVTRLRDMTGIVWYVRNGEILRVANRSQGWTMAVIDIPVAYDEDLNRVKLIVDEVAEAMVTDPESTLAEFNRPTYAGVESVSGEAVYIRILAKSAPDDQVPLTRAIRQGVKHAFDDAGIAVPAVYRPPAAQATGGKGGAG